MLKLRLHRDRRWVGRLRAGQPAVGESGKHKVLLLEAGGKDFNFWIHVPMGYAKTFVDPRVNWMFESEPEERLNNRTMYQPRGKVLGGTSSINGMIYMRGHAADYDQWRQLGNEGWDYESVLPYFRKAEDNERGADEFHGSGGPLRVSNQPYEWEIGKALLEACKQAGIPELPTSTARSRRAADIIRPPPITSVAGAPPPLTSNPRAPAQSEDRNACPCHPGADRERPRGGGRISNPGRPQDRARARRGHRLGRCVRFAAFAATVGYRTGRAFARHGY